MAHTRDIPSHPKSRPKVQSQTLGYQQQPCTAAQAGHASPSALYRPPLQRPPPPNPPPSIAHRPPPTARRPPRHSDLISASLPQPLVTSRLQPTLHPSLPTRRCLSARCLRPYNHIGMHPTIIGSPALPHLALRRLPSQSVSPCQTFPPLAPIPAFSTSPTPRQLGTR